MPKMNERELGLGGLGDLAAMADAQQDLWLDCDKARVIDPATLAAWPGFARVGMRLFSPALHGAAREDLMQLIIAPAAYARKTVGHLLALVDRNPDTEGRILGIAYQDAGAHDDQLVGPRPARVSGSGLDDIEAKGPYTGAAASAMTVEIAAAGTPDTLRWSSDGGATWAGTLTLSGDWQELEQGVWVRFGESGGHTVGDRWVITAGARPALAANLYRVHPHDYASLAVAKGKTLIHTGFNPVLVDDGWNVREAGLRAPRMRPVVAGDVSSSLDLGATDADPVAWTAAADDIATARVSANPAPAAGAACVAIALGLAQRKAKRDLAYHDVTATIPASAKRVQVYLRNDLYKGKMGGNKVALVFASGAGLSGTRVEIPVGQPLPAGQWVLADVPWEQTADFALASVGIKQIGSFDAGMFQEGVLHLYLDQLSIAEVSQSSDMLDGDGEWHFRFCWHDTQTLRQSAPSPYTLPIRLKGSGVALDLAGYQPGDPPGLANTPPPGADAVMVYVANSSWGEDPRLGGLDFHRVGEAQALCNLTRGAHGELILTLSDEMEKTLVSASDNPRAPFFNAQPPGGELAIAHGNLIVSAVRPAYTVGQWTWSDGSHLITPVASGLDTPRPGLWMEGRSITREGDSAVYTIAKVLDQDGDGVPDALFIGRDFDAATQSLATPYQGRSGAGKGVIVEDARTIYWSNVSEEFGVDVEAASPLNQLEIMPAGDKIIGGGVAGGFLWILGADNAFVLSQNAGALADLPSDTGAAYASPTHLPGVGLAARRTFTARPDGSCLWLGAHGELFVGQDAQVQRHPLSDRLAAFLSGQGFLADGRSLKHSFAVYKADGRDEYLYLGLIAGVDESPLPGVVTKAEDTYNFSDDEPAPGEESFVDWSLYPVDGWIEFATGSNLNEDATCVSAFDAGVPFDAGFTSPDAAAGAEHPYQQDEYRAENAWQPYWSVSTAIRADVERCPTEAYVTGMSDPLFIAAAEGHGGRGRFISSTLTAQFLRATSPSQIFFPFGQWGVWHHEITLTSATPVGPLASHSEMDPADYSFEQYDLAPSGVAYLTFELYVAGADGQSLPAGALGVRIQGDFAGMGAGTYDFTIEQAIPTNQWTKLSLAISPPGAPVGAGLDKLYVWTIMLNQALDPAVFESDKLSLRLANGRISLRGPRHQLTDPYTYAPENCVPVGSALSTGALAQDFETGLLLDLKRGLLFAASDCRFTCTGIGPTNSCTADGQMPGPVWMGDRDGYLNLTLEPTLLSWGSPATRFVHAVAGGDGASVTIDQRFEGSPGVIALPTDLDGAGLLDGLTVAKLTPATGDIEYRRIQANTASTITVGADWAAPPTAADLVIIGPLAWSVIFAEARGHYPLCLISLAMNAEHDASWLTKASIATFSPRWWLEVRAADGLDNQANRRVAARTKTFTLEDLRRRRRIQIAPKVAKALAYRLTGLGPMTGPVRQRGIKVVERVHPLEAGQ